MKTNRSIVFSLSTGAISEFTGLSLVCADVLKDKNIIVDENNTIKHYPGLYPDLSHSGRFRTKKIALVDNSKIGKIRVDFVGDDTAVTIRMYDEKRYENGYFDLEIPGIVPTKWIRPGNIKGRYFEIYIENAIEIRSIEIELIQRG